MRTPILTPEKVIMYAERRLFGDNVKPRRVRAIELHNGVLPSTLEEHIARTRGTDYVKVRQENPREPIYFHDGVLYIPQYSGFGRRIRYETTIEAYLKASKRPIVFSSLDFQDNRRQTNVNYGNFMYDFTKTLVSSGDFDGVRGIIIGGKLAAVARQAKVIKNRPSEYLDSQLIEVLGRKVLHIAYVFADQGGVLVEKLSREAEAIARSTSAGLHIPLLGFGRVGILSEEIEPHELVYITSTIEENELFRRDARRYPMDNILAPGKKNQGANLHVSSVITETSEQLRAAREMGCICAEMESLDKSNAVKLANRWYLRQDRPSLSFSFGFTGYAWDKPLEPGRDISVELSSDRGEQAAIKVILDYIRKQQA